MATTQSRVLPQVSADLGRSAQSSANFLVCVAILVAGLYFFRDVFIPIALSILVSFILAPIVRLLMRAFIPRILSVLLVVALAFSIVAILGAVASFQIGQLANDLPKYDSTIREKIKSFRSATFETGSMRRATNALNNLKAGIEQDKRAEAAPDQVADNAEPKPTLVEVHQPAPTTMESLRNFLVPILSPIETTAIIIVLVVFILMQQADLRNRFIRLTGIYDLHRTTKAIDDAGRRLSRFLLRQAIINAAFAFVVAGGLWLIGIPGAFLWGLLAGLLRFIPYVGTIGAVICPLLLALSIDSGWSSFFWTLALFIVLEPTVGYGIEPLVYGRSVGLSPVAVVASAVFWTSLWGPIGLLLSTPLTVCLVVLGRHVEGLSFLEVMLSDKDPLTAAQIFYQRILEGNAEEAVQYAEDCMKEISLEHYYEHVVLEGLRLAQVDIWRGVVSAEAVNASLDEFFSQFAERHLEKIEREVSPTAASSVVLCIAGPGIFDRHITVMLSQLLRQRGIDTRVTTSLLIDEVTTEFPETFISCIDSTSLSPLRLMVRRMREKQPQSRITLGLWMLNNENAAAQRVCKIVRADATANTLPAALGLTGTAVEESGQPA